MRRISTWLLSTIAAVVLLFSYHTSTDSVAQSAAVPTAVVDSGISVSQPTIAATPTAAAQTITGAAVDTRYGPVQVQITVADGAITAATASEYPTENGRDQQINSRAVPVLEQETVGSQSADIDMVSGATYTSEGYVQSLQSAIDQANLG